MGQGWISLRMVGDAGEPFRQLWAGDPKMQALKRRFEAIKEPEDFMNAMRAVGQVQLGSKIRESFRLADEMRRDVKDRHAWVHTAYPEAKVLDRMLDQWEGLVLNAVKDLQGRAAVVSELLTKQVTYMPNLPLILSIRNDGLNIAESVRVIVEDGEGYRVTDGAQQTIDILTAKSEREVAVTIAAADARSGAVELAHSILRRRRQRSHGGIRGRDRIHRRGAEQSALRAHLPHSVCHRHAAEDRSSVCGPRRMCLSTFRNISSARIRTTSSCCTASGAPARRRSCIA